MLSKILMGYEVDFLAVGDGEKSGDAITLRFGNLYGRRNEQIVVVIDGGYRESGERLVEHIRHYYQTERVDLVVSTHPDGDHACGLQVVLESLKVDYLWMHQPWNHTRDIARLFKDGRVTDNSVCKSLRESLEAAYRLEKLAKSKRIPIIEPFYGLSYGFKDASSFLRVLGPTEEFYENQLPYFRGTPEPREDTSLFTKLFAEAGELVRTIPEWWHYETLNDDGETSAENDSSTILLLTIGNRSLLFTADAGIPALTEVVNCLEWENFDFSTLKFVQIPHHGSRRNVGPSLLNRLLGSPTPRRGLLSKTSFVSAAKKGAPKHPSKKVTNAFQRRGFEVHATQGVNKWHSYNAPPRGGWTTSTPLQFYTQVEE
jgi:beta-lactamase superfamily II metal-dependent hydrolase